jgi:hypothetical protein
MMENRLLGILQHSLGVDEHGQGHPYRNHFATGPGSTDFESCQRLCEMDLMKDLGQQDLWGRMHCFVVTQKGIEAVATESPKPPRLSRSQRRYRKYLEIGDMFDNFKHFLAYDTDRRRKSRGFL